MLKYIFRSYCFIFQDRKKCKSKIKLDVFSNKMKKGYGSGALIVVSRIGNAEGYAGVFPRLFHVFSNILFLYMIVYINC